MKGLNAILLVAAALVLSLFTISPAVCFAADFFLHSTTSDLIDNTAPVATAAKFGFSCP